MTAARGKKRATVDRNGASGALLAMGCLAALAPMAQAQEVRPLLGTTQVGGPTSQGSAGNSDRFVIRPSVRTLYETNALKDSDPVDDSGNFRITPGIDADISRLFGRTQVKLGGSAGYDYNTRFKFLDRVRIDVDGSVQLPVGARCPVTVEGAYNRSLLDLADTTGGEVSTQTTQEYDVSIVCGRSAGFAPEVGASYRRFSSGNSITSTSQMIRGRAGLRYAKPSLGIFIASLSVAEIKRERPQVTGDETSRLDEATLRFQRDVSSQISLMVGGGYYWARSKSAGVGSSSGPSFDGLIRWRPTPRLSLSATAVRQVSNTQSIAASYQRIDRYALGAQWGLSSKTALNGSASLTKRQFEINRAVTPADFFTSDRTITFGAGVSHQIARNLSASANVTHRKRNASGDRFDYDSTAIGAGIGLKF